MNEMSAVRLYSARPVERHATSLGSSAWGAPHDDTSHPHEACAPGPRGRFFSRCWASEDVFFKILGVRRRFFQDFERPGAIFSRC